MHSEDCGQAMETFVPPQAASPKFTTRIGEETNAAHLAPCFGLYAASLKLLFICFLFMYFVCLLHAQY